MNLAGVRLVNNDLDKSNLSNYSPKQRPTPTFFFTHTTFSTKKERTETPKLLCPPPRPPIKSCPPISRLKPQIKQPHGAKVISFVNNTNNNNTNKQIKNAKKEVNDVISKHYDEKKHDLFFEQCFLIEGTLGCGSFGKVYKVKSKEDGKYYAVKRSREKFKGNADRIRRLEEVAKHEELPPHPNCVRFYRAWEEKQRLYIQIELCQMSLSSYADTHHEIPENIIWLYLVDLIQAIKHLHDRNLLHMDIKPENIFISYDGICKLGDFGLVYDLNKNDLTEAQEGDPKYLAPEVLKHGKYTKAADIFSLGMTILELATDLDVPRGGEGWHKLRTGKLPKDLQHNLSNNLVDIIVKMIDPNYERRLTVDQLLAIPIIAKYVQIRNRKLNWLKFISYFSNFYAQILRLSLTIWYFIVYPWRRLTNTHTSQLHHTSTPNRSNEKTLHNVSLLDNDDDDDDIIPNFHNDSFSTNNNSYGHPLNYSTSSSCTSEDHHLITTRLVQHQFAKTEPINKIGERTPQLHKHLSFSNDRSPSTGVDGALPTETTPTKTLGPARQKLLFDEDADEESDKELF